MLRERTDPGFWVDVVSHPKVEHVLMGRPPAEITDLVRRPGVRPLATEHGGFLFVPVDAMGRIFELHTLFKPEGWGREVLLAGNAALGVMFADADLIVTHEVLEWPRSRPPLTFRFQPAGDPFSALGHQMRLWTLSKTAWEGAPARRTACP